MLGTVSDYSLREGHSSVTIIRSTARQLPPGSKLYMFATDGSRAAAVAYCMLCHQLVQAGDRLLLVSCSYDHSSPGNVSAASMEYNTNFKDYREMAEALKVGPEDWCAGSHTHAGGGATQACRHARRGGATQTDACMHARTQRGHNTNRRRHACTHARRGGTLLVVGPGLEGLGRTETECLPKRPCCTVTNHTRHPAMHPWSAVPCGCCRSLRHP